MCKSVAGLLVAAVLVVGLLPSSVRAQSLASGGAIEGTVTDQSGAVLPGVTVVIRNAATGVSRDTVTNSVGVYRAPLLQVGLYEVTASLTGFATTTRPNLTLTIGRTLVIDLALKVSGQQEAVMVNAEAPVIETTRSQQSSTVASTAVSNLPVNGRNFIDFVLTTPGVTRDVRGGDISFAGQRGTLNSLVIDGADNNNTFFGQTLGRTGSGRAPYQFSQDAVQEFQVNRNAYSAEYGRAGGAVINVVTKSGTNVFHGSAFEFFEDKSLNANSYANKTASPIRARSPFRINQFGGSLGGPIKKDKAFFFLSYDGQRRKIPNDVILTIPSNLPNDPDTQAGLATLKSKADSYQLARDQDVFLAKLDYQINQKTRLTVRYNHQNFTGLNNENSGVTNSLEHTGDSLVKTRTANLSLASVFSATFFNEFRIQYAKDSEPGLANSASPEATVRQGGATILVIGRNNFSPRETTINRVQFADTVSLVRGAHSWKTGFDVNLDNIKNYFPGNFSGNYLFGSLGSFNRGFPNGAGETYTQAFAGPGTTGPETHPDIKEYTVFAQDEWRLKKNVTLNLGLRYDIQSFAQPQVKNPDPQLLAAGLDTSFLKTDKNNFAPRLGLAWSPNAKVVVRAGYGLFYGRTPSIMVGTAHSNNGINVQTVTFTGNTVPRYPANFATLPTGITLPNPSIFVFDPNYENPEVHQASAGLDYQLNEAVSVGVSYLFVAGRKLQRSTDINVLPAVATPIPILGGGSVTIQQFPTARPFTRFARIIQFQSSAESQYNGLTFEIKRLFRGKFQGSFAYTLGKVEDTVPDATAVVPGGGDDAKFASNPLDFEADRAAGNNDIRHRLVASGYWDAAYFKGSSGFKKVLLDGWALSWILTAQSGAGYSEAIQNDVNRDGNTRNDIVPGTRNSHRTPWIGNVDLRVSRAIPLRGRTRLQLIAEAFNLLNSTLISAQRNTLYNFTGGVLVPQLNLSNPRLNFAADSAAADARVVQLAAKITF